MTLGPRPAPDPESESNERPGHVVTLPRFYMARYPVTVAQWRAYHRATGARVSDESLQGEPTHPVVNVSWWDAMAYCAWLTTELRTRARAESGRLESRRTLPGSLATLLLHGDGDSEPWVVTLPSEAEWEKAARGTRGHRYPWGDTADRNRANHWQDGGLRTTSAAGCFPGGASPHGAEELAGNTWEWTRSEMRAYPYDPADGRERANALAFGYRVVRGGAFLSHEWRVRAAVRFRVTPAYRDYNVGCRLVVSPFPSDL